VESSRKLINLQKIDFEEGLWGNMNLEEGSSKVIENEINQNIATKTNKEMESRRASKPDLKIITNQKNLTVFQPIKENPIKPSIKEIDWKKKRMDFLEKKKKTQTLPKEQKQKTENLKKSNQKSGKCRIF